LSYCASYNFGQPPSLAPPGAKKSIYVFPAGIDQASCCSLFAVAIGFSLAVFLAVSFAVLRFFDACSGPSLLAVLALAGGVRRKH
jgi:hypothetical protein